MTLEEKARWTEVTNLSKDIHALPNKHGEIKKFRARVIAGRNFQVYQCDYENTYAPFFDFKFFLFVLIIAFVKGWFPRHVNVKASFLNGDIDRIIYVQHPYNLPKSNRRKTYLLHKSPYGLNQAAMLWFSKLRKLLVKGMQYTQPQTYCAVFYKTNKNGLVSIILAYVDD